MINMKKPEPGIIELDLSGEVTKADYEAVKPKIEAEMEKEGKQKFLFDLTETDGFTMGAVYEDIKFDLQNLENIGATAVVSQKKSREIGTKAIDLIFPENVRHFRDSSSAMDWLRSEAS